MLTTSNPGGLSFAFFALPRAVFRVAIMAVVFGATLVHAQTTTYTYDDLGRLRTLAVAGAGGVTYTYDAAGNRTNVAASTAPDTTPPTQPGATTFSNLTETSATATWGASTDNVGVTGYEYRVNTGNWTLVSSPTVNLTGLSALTNYTFDVRAKDAAGNVSSIRSTPLTTPDTTVPTTPATVGFQNVTGTTATANWSASTDNVAIAGYDYRLNLGGWVALGNVLTVNLSGLTGSTSYTFDVRARDTAGNVSGIRSGPFTTPDSSPPTQPGALVFSNITATTATATWGASTDNGGPPNYEVQINGAGWSAPDYVFTSLGLNGLSQGTTYTFEVRAVDASGNRSPIRSGTFMTLDTSAPTQPGATTFSSITSTTATASWGASTDVGTGVAGYDYRLNGNPTWTSLGNVLSVGLTGLASGTAYTFEVRARDGAGLLSPVRSGSFTTPDTIAPTQPGPLTFSSITETTATANWGASTDNSGFVWYDVRINGGGWSGAVYTSPFLGMNFLSPATTYTFEVRAADAAGNVSPIRSGSFTTSDTTAPTQPGATSFSSITGTTATASWGASTDNVGVAGYDYRLNGNPTWTSLGNVLSVGLTGLTSGTAYALDVRARDGAGNVSPARSGSFTTVDTSAPTQPGPLTFSNITQTTATANWGASTDNSGFVSYEIQINGGGWSDPVYESPFLGMNGLSPGTTYLFEVRAVDPQGNRGPIRSGSFATTDTTPPTAPGAPSFSNIAETTATASWGAASDSGGVAGYYYKLNSGAPVWLGSVLSVNLTGLSPFTGYTFEVAARDTAGNVGPFVGGTFTTAGQPTWILIALGVTVLSPHQAYYSCGEEGDLGIPYWHEWCTTVGGSLVWERWSGGMPSEWWADGYRNELEVRSDHYGF